MKLRHSNKAGFSLIEVVLALAIASFCIVSVGGLIPVGLQTNQTASGQTVTNGIVSSIVADLRSTPIPSTANPNPLSPQYGISIPANPVSTTTTTTLYFATDGSFNTVQQSNSVYMAVITFMANGSTSTGDKTSIFSSITVEWPIPASATPSTKCLNSYQTFIGLDRD